jgi:uncharacterized Zn finger protein
MEAKTGGCSNRLWMRLAGHREKNHPADAVGVYTARLPDIINQTNNDAYKEAVLLFKRICDCMKRMDKEKEFRTYCLALRGEHKRKRNFIKEMDHAGFL